MVDVKDLVQPVHDIEAEVQRRRTLKSVELLDRTHADNRRRDRRALQCPRDGYAVLPLADLAAERGEGGKLFVVRTKVDTLLALDLPRA